MLVPKPASASSAALSITSCTICRGLSVRVYMPGRCRTGSRPLSTWMDASSYRELVNFAPLPIFRRTPILRSKAHLGKIARTILDTTKYKYPRKPVKRYAIQCYWPASLFVGLRQQDCGSYGPDTFYERGNFPYSPCDIAFT